MPALADCGPLKARGRPAGGGTCFRGSMVQQTYLAGEIRAGSLEVAWSEWDLGNCAGLPWRGGQV